MTEWLPRLAQAYPLDAAIAVVRAGRVLKKSLTAESRGIIHMVTAMLETDAQNALALDMEALDRAEGESNEQWLAWCLWRDSGALTVGGPAARNMTMLAERTGLDQAYLVDAYNRFRWAARERVYDSLLARRAIELTADALVDMQKRQIAAGSRMVNIAINELTKLQKRAENLGDLEAIKPEVLVRFAEIGTKIERLARGESTENVRNEAINLKNLNAKQMEIYRLLTAVVRSPAGTKREIPGIDADDAIDPDAE